MKSEGPDPSRETLEAYEHHALQYIDRTSTSRSKLIDDLIAITSVGALELELGCGPGTDAAMLEAAGLIVDRTDGAAAFVNRLQDQGHAARLLRLDADDFGGPYDAVFAKAVLLHVPRLQLTRVLSVARQATRVDGVLVASFKKGSGNGWSEKKLDARRHFTYWQESGLREVALAAGWAPLQIIDSTQATAAEQWITLTARNVDTN